MNSQNLHHYELIERLPTVEEYRTLRESVGWGNASDEAIRVGLNHSLYAVCLTDGNTIIGCGRVIGDQGLAFYIRDIIVLSAYQGQGLGRKIVNAILAYLQTHAPDNAYVGLEAAKGKEPFYQKLGFIERPSEDTGSGMMWDSSKRC